jgi:glycosyltransferase involved in cell wall biosynthesis
MDVTVLLAARNLADSLPTWLAHLEQQTYPAAQFEILVIDDGSTDGTADRVRRYAAGAPVRTRCVCQARSGLVKARNLGLREAEGRWVLFLAHDVLASPRLLEQHVRAHNSHEETIGVAGSIRPHPRLAAGVLTRWFLPEDHRRPARDRPLNILECDIGNISLPRQRLLDSGGFSEAFAFPDFTEAELAWRLAKGGMQTFFNEHAHGYVAAPASFEAERRRQYGRGYSLRRLAELTAAREIPRRYGVRWNPLHALVDSIVMPFYIRACQQAAEDTRLLGHIYRRILRYELYCGYHDARRNRPPREDPLAL